ncbi:MAG: hypothetical protein MZV64_67355 [Ignavibacteriales bacterium]|nr:hypothetical protein [Ignavibacteriales bacterium]
MNYDALIRFLLIWNTQEILGFSAAQFILDGGSGAMVSIQNGKFVPMYFKDIIDPKTLKNKS